MVMTRPELRRESLKVITTGLTKTTCAQATEFIDQTRAFSIMFALWMQQPPITSPISTEHAKLHEQFISIFCNLMMALTSGAIDAKTQVCLERLSFKFVENRLEKLCKLVELHKVLYARIADFDLAEFK